MFEYVFAEKPLTIITKLYSFRYYGQPKLNKPQELKGIKQHTSVSFIRNKCTCPVFVKGDDVYIHHKDLFSDMINDDLDDLGTPLIYRLNKHGIKHKKTSKFIYDDNWGGIVLRNEGWILIQNLISDLKINNRIKLRTKIMRDLEKIFGFDELDLEVGDNDRFIDNVLNVLYNDFVVNKSELK